MTKKRLQKVMAAVYQKYGQTITAEIADNRRNVGFRYATLSGLSMGMDDFDPLRDSPKFITTGETRSANISDQYEQGFINDDERHR